MNVNVWIWVSDEDIHLQVFLLRTFALHCSHYEWFSIEMYYHKGHSLNYQYSFISFRNYNLKIPSPDVFSTSLVWSFCLKVSVRQMNVQEEEEEHSGWKHRNSTQRPQQPLLKLCYPSTGLVCWVFIRVYVFFIYQGHHATCTFTHTHFCLFFKLH